jgi:hypothetical protein
MGKTVTIVLLVIAAIIIFGSVLLCGIGGWFGFKFSKNVEKAQEEGREFGASTDQRGCLDETFKRRDKLKDKVDSIDSAMEQMRLEEFLVGCLEISKPTKGFCHGVPKASEFTKTIDWATKECQKIGRGNDDRCTNIYIKVWGGCAKRDDSTSNSPESEGTTFGKTCDQKTCLQETLKRYKENKTASASYSLAAFLQDCLKASSKTAVDFCKGVPVKSDGRKFFDWSKEQCKKEGLANDSGCVKIISEVQDFCGKSQTKVKIP